MRRLLACLKNIRITALTIAGTTDDVRGYLFRTVVRPAQLISIPSPSSTLTPLPAGARQRQQRSGDCTCLATHLGLAESTPVWFTRRCDSLIQHE